MRGFYIEEDAEKWVEVSAPYPCMPGSGYPTNPQRAMIMAPIERPRGTGNSAKAAATRDGYS